MTQTQGCVHTSESELMLSMQLAANSFDIFECCSGAHCLGLAASIAELGKAPPCCTKSSLSPNAVLRVFTMSAGKRSPEGGARRAHAARKVLPAVYRGVLQQGPAGADLPRDPALQPGLRRVAAKEAGH